jgi:hypothetical protein
VQFSEQVALEICHFHLVLLPTLVSQSLIPAVGSSVSVQGVHRMQIVHCVGQGQLQPDRSVVDSRG